jgi:hypothetical protein
MFLAKAAVDNFTFAELWGRLPKMILLLPNFGEGCRRCFYLCRTLAKIAADDFTFAELWRRPPQMILLLPNFGKDCRR